MVEVTLANHHSYAISPVTSRRDLNRFIAFPYSLYHKVLPPNCWVPPLRASVRKLLDQQRNPFYHAGGQCTPFLVRQGSDIVARFAISWAPTFVEKWNSPTAFFGFYEQVEDQKLANFIFDFAADYAKDAFGAKELMGPVNLSNNYQFGMLVDPFDQPPTFEMTYNPSYYPQQFEKSGRWEKAVDLFAFHLNTSDVKTEKMGRVVSRVMERYNIRIRPMNFDNFSAESEMVREIYNDAWGNNWAFTPLPKAEWDYLVEDIKKVAVREMLLVGFINDKPFGFCVFFPDLNLILKDNPHGRLFPSTIYKLLTRTKYIKTGRVYTTGIKQCYQHLGLGSLFYWEMYRIAPTLGYSGAELSWVLECNTALIHSLQTLGADISKTYRVYKSVSH